jgi:hypothetical protein
MEISETRRKCIKFILEEVIDDYHLWRVERKLKTTEEETEETGMVCKMEYIDKIYRKLKGIIPDNDLYFYMYNLKRVSTLRIMEKLRRINQLLYAEKKIMEMRDQLRKQGFNPKQTIEKE